MLGREISHALERALSSVAPVTDWATAITIILTALGVLLAALALMIGIAAIWGYREIKEEAKKVAEKAIADYLEKQGVSDKIRAEVLPRQLAEYAQGITATPYTGEEDTGHARHDNEPE